MPNLDKTFADKLTDIACKQYKVSFDFKKARMEQIRKNEEFYVGRKIKVPAGRFGTPLPTMAGFVDSLMSKIDDAPYLNFGYDDIADLIISKKITAMWKKDSHANRAAWALKDRWTKKLACFSGRPTFKIFSESDPNYRNYLEVVDYEDLMTEPMGGGNLEAHAFTGQDNIFKTDWEIKEAVEAGRYDRMQVAQLIARTTAEEYKKVENIYQGKAERYKMLGLDLLNNTYVGQPITKFIEWIMDYQGQRYYLLFEYFTKTWVRCQPLGEVFESELKPWVSWATHEDPFNFWSKAPCDDIRPVADAMDILFNQALDNRQKRNFGQRAYDPSIFTDPAELEWKPNGLVMGTATVKGKNLAQGIYEFQTPEVTGTIDMIGWLDQFLGRKSGVQPESEGGGAQDKVGIYFGNLQQMADRLGLYNKSYKEAHLALGERYAHGLAEHLSKKEAVKILGENGVELAELLKKEAKKAPSLPLEITGGADELAASELKSRKRMEVLNMLLRRPDLTATMNSTWLLTEALKSGSYEDAEIRTALTKDGNSLEMQSRAARAIDDIMNGKEPKPFRGADTSFIKMIMDYALDNEVTMNEYKRLTDFARMHMEVALKNMTRKALLTAAQNNTMAPPVPTPGGGQETMMQQDQHPEITGNKATNILKNG